MSQRHVAEANSSGANPRGDENGQLIEEVPQSNAGDALRQLGTGFCKMADVMDECLLAAKTIEDAFLERRYQDVLQVPCALVAGDEKSSFNAAVSDGQDEATPPGEFEGKVVQGTAAAAAAVAARDATSSGGGNSKKSKGGAGEGGDGGTARSAALLSSRRVSSEQGTSGRKGKRKMDLGVEDCEEWSGPDQALKTEEQSAAFAERAGTRTAGRGGEGVVRLRRPAKQDGNDMEVSAQPRLMNSNTCLGPSGNNNTLLHQEKHLEPNTKSAFGKRMMMEFSDRNYPWGINTDGCSAEDLSHPKERRKMPFDGCTRDRCKDGATDAMDRVEAPRAEFESPTVGHKACIFDVPGVAMELVVEYSDGGHLGEVSKSIRATMPVKYKVDASETRNFFHNDPDGVRATHHMGLDPRGTKLHPRPVKAITITGCYERTDMDIVSVSQEKAFRRVVAHAIPTLSSITLEGTRRAANTFVSGLLAGLLEGDHLAPFLVRVRLTRSPHSLENGLKAIMQGLWPALRVLEFPHCQANRAKMTRLATAVREGRLKNLRELNWDNQAEGGRRTTNLLLEALSTGACPEMEVLSFTQNARFDQMSLSFLGSALQACPKLKALYMDCTVDPRDQFRQLTNAITSGCSPALELICLQLKKGVPSDLAQAIVREGTAVEEAGEARRPTPVKVEISVGKKRG